MRIRSLLLDNLSWKLLSLTLALLIWSGARLFMRQGIRPFAPLAPLVSRELRNVPVRVLSAGNLPVSVAIEPATVMVEVGGDLPTMNHFTEQDAVVFVSLDAPDLSRPSTNRVEVRVPQAVRVHHVIPERVVLRPLSEPTPSP